MNVSLTPELEAFIQQKLDTGRYYSASEVVRAGLRLLEEREQRGGDWTLEKVQAEVQKGLDSLSAGRSTIVDEKITADQVKKRGRARLKAQKN